MKNHPEQPGAPACRPSSPGTFSPRRAEPLPDSVSPAFPLLLPAFAESGRTECGTEAGEFEARSAASHSAKERCAGDFHRAAELGGEPGFPAACDIFPGISLTFPVTETAEEADPALFPADEGSCELGFARFGPLRRSVSPSGEHAVSSSAETDTVSSASPARTVAAEPSSRTSRPEEQSRDVLPLSETARRAARRRRAETLLLFLFCSLLLTVSWVQAQQEALASKVIRLHVLAESDSREHQCAKLRARDAVLSVLTPALSGAENRREAEEIIRSMTEELAEAASSAACCPVRVSLSEEVYPTRRYEHFALPAGRYCSLRVTLGKGEGHNWWCVIYPALCTVTAEEHSTLAGNFDDKDWRLLTEDGGGYVLRFRLLDLWGNLSRAMTRHSSPGGDDKCSEEASAVPEESCPPLSEPAPGTDSPDSAKN